MKHIAPVRPSLAGVFPFSLFLFVSSLPIIFFLTKKTFIYEDPFDKRAYAA